MYSDLDMSAHPSSLSIWSPQTTLVGYPTASSMKPSMMTTEQVHSNSTTPEYSQTLSLETTMLSSSMNNLSSGNCLPTTVIAGNSDSRHPVCVDPSSTPSSAPTVPTPIRSINPRQGGRRNKSYVDPCEIAPLKKRRIQLELLNPDERDKILQKREKNKVAAEKCRVKRREKMQSVRVEYEECLVANEALEVDIAKLQEEKDKLEQLLKTHNCVLQQRV